MVWSYNDILLYYTHMKSGFIHLHTHSHYSLLDGLSKIPDIVNITHGHGAPAVAVTDHGNMHGAIEFYKACKKNGMRPIIGCEVYVAERTRFDKEPGIDNKRYHLILLAKNLTGYKNLLKIVTKANLEGYYYKPRVDMDLLKEHGEGIVCLSGCMGGKLSRAVLNGDINKAEELIREHQEAFGKDNYFIEIQSHPGIERDKELRDKLVELAKKHDITYVATQDSHYPCKDDHDAHRTLLAINTGADGKNAAQFEFSADDFSLIDEATALEYFKDYPEAVHNTMLVYDKIEDYEIELGVAYFPKYDMGDETISLDEKLRELAYAGFAFRKLQQTPEYTKRLDYELEVIKKKGYPGYFLVVSDLLRFARENGILTNIRGSVAGSLTTYLLGITNVDPLVYKLPFERFLNPERPSLPDIDMDYADNRRHEVIAYAKEKYGADKVAQIGTFGTMMAKGSVRDVARALGYPYAVGDKISSMIPLGSQGFPMTIDKALELVPELMQDYKTNADTKKIIDLAKKMEGCVRHVSVHAAGVVIAPTELTDFVPVQFDPKGGDIITQYDMHYVEEVGLPKFDFLGIRNLAILADAVNLVEKIHGVKIDLDNIPLDDPKTFDILARGETMGLFQLNGTGMTSYLKQLKPSTIFDINAMVALYRPGPLEMIPEYIARKHDNSKIKYLDPRMKSILDQSFGVITYQDDVMMIAIELAGYSWLEADKLRKAMGKKIPAEMEAQKEKLLSGLIEHGMSEKKSDQLWKLIEPFAAYGFNKAHAASYGLVAYQTAYMKANYPVEYINAILTAESGDVEKIAEIIDEAKRMGITVLPPDINASYGGFTVVHGSEKDHDQTIRFGLYTIKNLGGDIADHIIAERKSGGPYKSLEDLLQRVNNKNFNKKSFEALVKSGALDSMGERGQLLANTESILEFNKKLHKEDKPTGPSLFGNDFMKENVKLRLITANPMPTKDMLFFEKELLGLYVSGHPLEEYREKIEKLGRPISDIKANGVQDEAIIFAGIITDIRDIFTKKNDRMAIVKIADFTSTIEIAVFPKVYNDVHTVLVKDTCVAIKGKVNIRNDEKSAILDAIKVLTN